MPKCAERGILRAGMCESCPDARRMRKKTVEMREKVIDLRKSPGRPRRNPNPLLLIGAQGVTLIGKLRPGVSESRRAGMRPAPWST